MQNSNTTPHLLRAMQWVAILSRTEAESALRDYRAVKTGQAHEELLRWGGGEAVGHFGGPLKLIERAVAMRHVLRDMGTLRTPPPAIPVHAS